MDDTLPSPPELIEDFAALLVGYSHLETLSIHLLRHRISNFLLAFEEMRVSLPQARTLELFTRLEWPIPHCPIMGAITSHGGPDGSTWWQYRPLDHEPLINLLKVAGETGSFQSLAVTWWDWIYHHGRKSLDALPDVPELRVDTRMLRVDACVANEFKPKLLEQMRCLTRLRTVYLSRNRGKALSGIVILLTTIGGCRCGSTLKNMSRKR